MFVLLVIEADSALDNFNMTVCYFKDVSQGSGADLSLFLLM